MELFELDINALSKGKKEAFFILYKKLYFGFAVYEKKFTFGKKEQNNILK